MNKVLIVVDMQNDFIDGSLGSPEALKIVDNVIEKIIDINNENSKIICTQDTHFEKYLETLEGQKLPVKHCIINTEGWLLNKKISQVLKDYKNVCYIQKNTFGYLDWEHLIPKDTEQIELCGLCTDICVVSNALILRALYPNMIIKIDESCCAGVTPESHKNALETMKMCQIDIV